jgi:hypothetical protein
MKKSFFTDLFVFTGIAILLIGCTRSTRLTAVPLEIDGEKITIEFQQNDASLPLLSHEGQWNVVLKPEPFTLKVNGDKKNVSIMALQSPALASPLLQASKPWVAPLYTGNGFVANDLYLSYRSLDFYTVNADTLQNIPAYSFSAEEAAKMASTLKNQLGTEPPALLSARTYLPEPDQDYFVKTINGSTPQSGESFVLLVCMEKQSGDPFFKILKWVAFNVEFH